MVRAAGGVPPDRRHGDRRPRDVASTSRSSRRRPRRRARSSSSWSLPSSCPGTPGADDSSSSRSRSQQLRGGRSSGFALHSGVRSCSRCSRCRLRCSRCPRNPSRPGHARPPLQAPPFVWTTSKSDMLSYLAARRRPHGRDCSDRAEQDRARSRQRCARTTSSIRTSATRRERTVLLVEHQGGDVPPAATWLVAAPGASIERCGRWKREYDQNGWVVERRLDSASTPCVGLQTAP